jgi:hypothetical protein
VLVYVLAQVLTPLTLLDELSARGRLIGPLAVANEASSSTMAAVFSPFASFSLSLSSSSSSSSAAPSSSVSSSSAASSSSSPSALASTKDSALNARMEVMLSEALINSKTDEEMYALSMQVEPRVTNDMQARGLLSAMQNMGVI